MKNRYFLYLTGMGLLAVLFLVGGSLPAMRATLAGLMDGSSSVQPAFVMVFALLAHGPAFLTVAQQNNLLGKPTGVIGRYPEALVPVLVLASWMMAGLAGQMGVGVFAGGVIAAIALVVCYAAVRLVVATSAKTAGLSSHVPGFSSAPLGRVGAQGIYAMRILAAAASLYALVVAVRTDAVPVWLVLALLVIGGAAALLGWFAITAEREVARRAASTATQALSGLLRAEPSEVAVYYSGPATSKHTAPVKLAGQLAEEGMPPVIIAREGGARKALVKAPHRHLWVLGTIDTLDAAAYRPLRVVFYVNDAAKNGHFIRFNEFAHVLVATGSIAAGPSLPRSCAMYDMIVAPSAAKADLWRTAAGPELVQRIVTLGPQKASSDGYKMAQTYPPACPVLSLYLGAPPLAGETPDLAPFLEMVPRLIAAANARASARLEIWFPAPAQGTSDPMLRLLHRDVEMAIEASLEYDEEGNALTPLVSQHTGTPQAAANAADFPVLIGQSDLEALRGTGKPLLWFDPAEAPEGVQRLGESAEDYAAALQALWSKPAVVKPSDEASPQDLHFTSYADLIAAVAAQKQTAAQGETS